MATEKLASTRASVAPIWWASAPLSARATRAVQTFAGPGRTRLSAVAAAKLQSASKATREISDQAARAANAAPKTFPSGAVQAEQGGIEARPLADEADAAHILENAEQ